MIAERDVEKRFEDCARRHGCWAPKLTSPGNAGMPDRIVLFPDGRVQLVELKGPRGRVRPLQARMFRRLEEMGHPVTVIKTLEGVSDFWRDAV